MTVIYSVICGNKPTYLIKTVIPFHEYKDNVCCSWTSLKINKSRCQSKRNLKLTGLLQESYWRMLKMTIFKVNGMILVLPRCCPSIFTQDSFSHLSFVDNVNYWTSGQNHAGRWLPTLSPTKPFCLVSVFIWLWLCCY